jgi:acetyl esterase/lipase
MKKVFVLVLCAFFTLAVAALAQAPPGVSVEKDVTYGRTDGVDLKLDLAEPAASTGPVPAIVCIHGGGWMSGSKSAYEPIIRQFADAGYVAAAVEYRFAPTHKWPAQVEDVKCAVRYLRAHAKELNIDPNKIGAIGDSAGGHLALLLGLMDPKDRLEGNGGNPAMSSKVQAVVNIYGPVDLRTWHVLPEAETAAAQSFGKSSEMMLADFVGTSDRTAALMAQASPITYISVGDPPILTFHGTKDPIVPFDQATTLQAALEKAGVTQKLVPLEGGGHGLDPLQIAIVSQQALAFFDSYLKGTPVPAASNPKEGTQATR